MAGMTRSRVSCGVYEFFGLGHPSHILLKHLMGGYKYQANDQNRARGFAQVVWSDADEFGNGARFAAYIKKNFPRSVLVQCSSSDSPSTGRNITTWVWSVPHVSLARHKFYAHTRPRPHGF